MTFYDSFLPSFDYDYHPFGYQRRPAQRVQRNPYQRHRLHQPLDQEYSHVHPYSKQQQYQHHPRFDNHPSRVASNYSTEGESEDDEYELNHSPLKRRVDEQSAPVRRWPPQREADRGVKIPVKRMTTEDQRVQAPQSFKKRQDQKPSVSVPQNFPKTKITVEKSSVDPLRNDDPLIVELSPDQIPPSSQDNHDYNPGRVQYLWEDEDDQNEVIETIIDCSPSRVSSEGEAGMTESVYRSKEETEKILWQKELDIFDFLGFHDSSELLPLFRQFLRFPTSSSSDQMSKEEREAAFQNILKNLIEKRFQVA